MRMRSLLGSTGMMSCWEGGAVNVQRKLVFLDYGREWETSMVWV